MEFKSRPSHLAARTEGLLIWRHIKTWQLIWWSGIIRNHQDVLMLHTSFEIPLTSRVAQKINHSHFAEIMCTSMVPNYSACLHNVPLPLISKQEPSGLDGDNGNVPGIFQFQRGIVLMSRCAASAHSERFTAADWGEVWLFPSLTYPCLWFISVSKNHPI